MINIWSGHLLTSPGGQVLCQQTLVKTSRHSVNALNPLVDQLNVVHRVTDRVMIGTGLHSQ